MQTATLHERDRILIEGLRKDIAWLKSQAASKVVPKQPEWVSQDEACKVLGRQREWLRLKRKDKTLIEGTDWKYRGNQLVYKTESIKQLSETM